MKDQKSLRQTNYLMLALTVILIGVILCLSIGMSGSPVSDNTEKPFTSLYDASDDMLQIIDFNVGISSS